MCLLADGGRLCGHVHLLHVYYIRRADRLLPHCLADDDRVQHWANELEGKRFCLRFHRWQSRLGLGVYIYNILLLFHMINKAFHIFRA